MSECNYIECKRRDCEDEMSAWKRDRINNLVKYKKIDRFCDGIH